MKRFSLLMLFAIPFFSNELIGAEYSTIPVYSRMLLNDYVQENFILEDSEKKWLSYKKKLILATSEDDNPPLEFSKIHNVYEGVTADVIGLLSSELNIPIIVQRYKDRVTALKAVQEGNADMIGVFNSDENQYKYLLTKPYIPNKTVLYIREGINSDDIKSIAISKDYLPDSNIRELLNKKKFSIYKSRGDAVANAAYHRDDAVLVDIFSGNYLVNKYYFGNLRFGETISTNHSSGGFVFALSKENKNLQVLLNKIIDKKLHEHINEIYQRWSGGGVSLQGEMLHFTQLELDYLNRHKEIILAVNARIPPIGFIDQQGNYRGVMADLIDIIKRRAGINVRLIVMDSLENQLQAVRSGEVDLTIAGSHKAKELSLKSSQYFYAEPLVYVVKKNHDNKYIDSLDLKPNGVFGLIRGTVAEKVITDYKIKSSNIKYFNSYDEVLICVSSNQCSAAIMPLKPANYFINSLFAEELYIGGEFYNSNPVTGGFVTRNENAILINIINKVVNSISPEELDSLSARWRVNAKKEETTVSDFLEEFWIEFIVFWLVLFISILWGYILYRQSLKLKSTQLELKLQLKFMNDLVDSIPHPIFARDESNRFIICNESYASFINLEKEKIIGHTILNEILSDESQRELRDIYIKLHENGNHYAGDHILKLRDGRVFNVYYWLHIYYDLSNKEVGIVGGWLDISERHRLMEELAEASRLAEYANRAKTTFLATMSHEIRTPMNAIIGLLELTLRKGGISAQLNDSIEIALNSSKELLGLIGDILDVSKIESGKFDLSPSPHGIAELSRSVINVFSANAREKGLYLACSIDEEQTVLIDSMRYKQIISNLISNAIKFTHRGGVELTLTLLNKGDECVVTINVTDTGIGISQDDQARLFQPFSQVEQSHDEYRSGTGLGLMICRTLCEMMGGRLELMSEPGQGTRVLVSLRLPIVASSAMVRPSLPTLSDISAIATRSSRILIIDDHPTNRLLVNQQLTFLGHEVTMAESGRDALEQLVDQRFDFIITDFNMPDINGLDFTERYRQQERDEQRERTVIIGLTADARQEQIQHAIEVGMDDCLFKPVSLDQIRDCLAKHDPRPSGNDEQVTTSAAIAERIDQVLGGLAAGNTQFMLPLLQEFLKATDEDIAMLTLASNDNDSRRFLDYLHRIKGGARIIGADHLVECCTEWEQEPQLSGSMPSALDQVNDIYGQVKQGVLYWQESKGVIS